MNRVLWARLRMAWFMLGITLMVVSRGDISRWSLDHVQLECTGWDERSTSRTLTIQWLVS